MPSTKRPRKAYHPKCLRIPITGLAREFALTLHTSLYAMRRQPSPDAFYGISRTINVISRALADMERNAEADRLYRIIQGGAGAMQQVADREQRTGQIQMTDLEFVPVSRAVEACELALGRLDVFAINDAMQKLDDEEEAA